MPHEGKNFCSAFFLKLYSQCAAQSLAHITGSTNIAEFINSLMTEMTLQGHTLDIWESWSLDPGLSNPRVQVLKHLLLLRRKRKHALALEKAGVQWCENEGPAEETKKIVWDR